MDVLKLLPGGVRGQQGGTSDIGVLNRMVLIPVGLIYDSNTDVDLGLTQILPALFYSYNINKILNQHNPLSLSVPVVYPTTERAMASPNMGTTHLAAPWCQYL